MVCINSVVDVVIKFFMEVLIFINIFNNKQGGDGCSFKWKILVYDNLFVKLYIIVRIYIFFVLLVKFKRDKGFFFLKIYVQVIINLILLIDILMLVNNLISFNVVFIVDII